MHALLNLSICLSYARAGIMIGQLSRPPARNAAAGMANVSGTSSLHGTCEIFVDGTKISAELNNL